MSELKAGVIKTSYGEGFCFVVNDVYYDCDEYETKFYLKSEADKVIAEKDKEIAELKEERRWRKFSEEKPTEDIKFLVINEKGLMQCCYYSPILHEFQIPVTHWMPLPSAPKEEN